MGLDLWLDHRPNQVKLATDRLAELAALSAKHSDVDLALTK